MDRRFSTIALFCVLTLAACGDDAANVGARDATSAPDAGPDVSGDASEDASGDSGASSEGTVSTTEGPVEGAEDGGVWSFKGIPYAQPPVGELRWRAPKPPEARSEAFSADTFGAACPQNDGEMGFGNAGPKDEDCLTLNIWTPELDPDEPRPVMFWIHGGGFIQGSSRFEVGGTTLYEGAELARDGVVVVSINYRLGALGFLAHQAFVGEDDDHPAAGNYGLLDQLRALEWVQDNVAQFGGDPDQVTIFGESAGGVSVCALMASPLGDGLFDRAIMQSGNCLDQMRRLEEARGGLEAATDQGARFAEAIGCGDAADVKACLRSKSVDEISHTMPGTVGMTGDGESYEPIVDGHLLDRTLAAAVEDGSFKDLPFLIGVNADEGTLFTVSQQNMSAAQYEAAVRAFFPEIGDDVLGQYPAGDYDAPWKALAALVGDIAFVCPSRQAARAHAANGNATYTYYFTHVTAVGAQYNLGAFHGAELSFVFGNFGAFGGQGAEGELAEAMQGWWTQFARGGAPGTYDGLEWPAYAAGTDEGMQLDAVDLGVTSGFRGEFCDFWDGNR